MSTSAAIIGDSGTPEGRPVPPDVIPADVRENLRVLVIDDERTLRDGCVSALQHEGYNVASSGRGDEALKMVQTRKWDVILCDLYMTPVSGMEILKATLQANPDTLFIMMTGNPSVASSLDALREGAWDYLPKPFNSSHLHVMLGRAANATMVSRATKKLRTESPAAATPDAALGGVLLLGKSPAFRRSVDLAKRVALTDASVMITGESGTGKEVIAQFIHQNSRRASRSLVPVNCAALPEPLLESELFGHRRGAFTGADRDKPGLLETANGSTFFLDELTEAPLSIQAKLLRVIQDGVVRRVGSEQHDAIVDVRFISATNRDPQEAVAQGVLREDLFYRLRVVPIRLPALRERTEDIPLLAEHFLTHFWTRHRGADAVPTFSDGAMAVLQARPWRGNVRELQNVVEYIAVLVESGSVIQPQDVPIDDTGSRGETPAADATASAFPADVMSMEFRAAKEAVITRFEREYLTRLVAQSNANMSKAARAARVDRTTLYRLMEKHGFTRTDLAEDNEA
jgi:DNA-binding NtrC family response regulator